MQTQHVSIQYHDIHSSYKVVITVLVPCIKFIEVEAKRELQKIEQSFCGSGFSHVKHTPFTLEGSELHQMTYTCAS
jgi:hypothetical protein